MLPDPKPLAQPVIIEDFVPDSNLSWLSAYAGPCGDPACTEVHVRLYLVPVIGWLKVVKPAMTDDEFDDMELRPAVMTQGGTVTDYLDLPEGFAFIAVIPAGSESIKLARSVYLQRFGDSSAPLIEKDRVSN